MKSELRRNCSGGEPMGAITVGPLVNPAKTCAGRGAVKVTMASALLDQLHRCWAA